MPLLQKEGPYCQNLPCKTEHEGYEERTNVKRQQSALHQRGTTLLHVEEANTAIAGDNKNQQ